MSKKLIGTTEIELIDARTGEVKKYTEQNMITGRLQKLFGKNPFGACSSYFMTPITKTVLGGIALFPEAQEENVNNDLLFEDFRTGGTLNKEETGILEKGTGFKWVWDYDYSEANGVIASVSLANSSIDGENFPYFMQCSGYRKDNIPAILGNMGPTHYDSETKSYYRIRLPYGGSLALTKWKRPAYSIPLYQYNGEVDYEQELDPNVKFSIKDGGISTGIPIPEGEEEGSTTVYNLCNTDEGVNSVSFRNEDGVPYLYIFTIGGPDGTEIDYSKIYITKINLKTYTATQSSLTLNGATVRVGINKYERNHTGSIENYIVKDYFPFIGDYLYVYSGENSNEIYKVNINNATDIYSILADGDLQIDSISGVVISNDYGWTYLAVPQTREEGVDNTYQTFEITNDEIKLCAPLSEVTVNNYMSGPLDSYQGISEIIAIDDTYGIVNQTYLDWSDEEMSISTIVYFNRYKATINNLTTPISKTINERMKITYIIREIET